MTLHINSIPDIEHRLRANEYVGENQLNLYFGHVIHAAFDCVAPVVGVDAVRRMERAMYVSSGRDENGVEL